jgi:hypothetical protein
MKDEPTGRERLYYFDHHAHPGGERYSLGGILDPQKRQKSSSPLACLPQSRHDFKQAFFLENEYNMETRPTFTIW